jgi:hypothetical protein
MLLVCNGAQKSGSTWLYNILTSLVDCKEPDPEYLTGNSKNPCIAPGKFESFLQNVDFVNENYISKNHLSTVEQRDLLLKYNGVYIFDIERDPRDVVVSSYYDARNRFGYDQPFLKFYWTNGRELVAKLMAYHELWRNSGVRCHVASFEGLKNTFPSDVRGIAGTLHITLSDEEIEQLYEDTNMDKLRKKYANQELYAGDKFFRKGIVGDWGNHFDNRSLNDLESILKSGISPLDLRHVLFQLRSWLNWQLNK